METIKDALGSLVAWPKEFVLLCAEEDNDDYVDMRGKDTDDDGAAPMINAFAQTLHSMKRNVIMIPLEKDLFGDENLESYVFKKELYRFCEMKTIDVTCIAAYMRYLYDKLDETYKFINPTSSSTTFKKALSQLITRRLEKGKGKEICFVPYNIQSKFHWVLMVIDCSSMIIFWLDSLHTLPDEQTKFYINVGLYALLVNGRRGQMPTWSFAMCPRQKGSVECGYYVMRFMKELIEYPSQSIEMKMSNLAKKDTYTQKEINEI